MSMFGAHIFFKFEKKHWKRFVFITFWAICFSGCSSSEDQYETLLTSPKTYLGSENCKVCHLEHYDSWKMTLHSRTIQDVTINRDAIITSINPVKIRSDLKKMGSQLKIQIKNIYIPKIEDIKYSIGIQWKQRFLVEKNGALYIAPIQYNAWNDTWVAYHENDWDRHPWTERCGGCHTTGLKNNTNTSFEPTVGCEACHGPGSHHVALPKTAIFKKRLTIINPSKLSTGIRTQICGGCHSRGVSTLKKNHFWPVDHKPGQALGPYFKFVEEIKSLYGEEVPDNHHRQYNDWQKSIHAKKGVSCTSCHYVHQLGLPPTQFQTKMAGSQQCLSCHKMVENIYAHSIHAFANCIGCHMPRGAQSIESSELLNHSFIFISPADNLKASNNNMPLNACSSCHHHRDTPLDVLAGFLEAAKKNDMPKPLTVHKTRNQ